MAMRSTYVIVICFMVTVAVAVATMVLQGEPQKNAAELPVTITTKTELAIELVYPKRLHIRPVKLEEEEEVEEDPCTLNSDGVEYDCSKEDCPTFPRAVDGTIRRCMCNGPNRPVGHMSATECLDPYLYTDVYGASIVPIEWSDEDRPVNLEEEEDDPEVVNDPCTLTSDGVEYDCSIQDCPTFPNPDGTIRRCMCNGPLRPAGHMSATECLDPYLYTDFYGTSIVPTEWSDQV